MTSDPGNRSAKHTKGWVLGLGLVGILTVLAALVLAQRPAATPTRDRVAADEGDAPALAEGPSEDLPDAAAAEEEAAERAQWEAQMQRLNEVVQSMDRAELIGGSPTKGPKDAPVVLIKFSDFQCPYCAVAAAEMKTFTASQEEDVLYVYKHFPLVSIHPEATPAAQATWAAAQQDQFWLYHDGLFSFQEKLGDAYYVELAEQIGLDMARFERDRNSAEAKDAVAKDAELAQQLALRGTPSFLMTNLTDSFLLPGGTPPEIFDEATQRLKVAANGKQVKLQPSQSQPKANLERLL